MCLLTKDVQSALSETGGRSKTAPLNTGSEATRHLSNMPSARLKRTYKAVSGPGARYRSASCARWAPLSGRAVFHRSERNVFPAFHLDCGGLANDKQDMSYAHSRLRTEIEFKLKYVRTMSSSGARASATRRYTSKPVESPLLLAFIVLISLMRRIVY